MSTLESVRTRPQVSTLASLWRSAWFGVLVFVVGVAVLARTQQYYGGLLRGWDAQFYYSCAHSLAFDGDVDAGNNLEATPFSRPFDRDGDGTLESLPRDAQGRIVNYYPVGLCLIEAPLLAAGRVLRGALARLGTESPRPPGYGDVEIWTVALGLLAIFAAGMQVLHALVRPHASPPWAEIALFAAWWGTSLLYYSAVFPFMAHAIAFALLVGAVAIGQAIAAGRRGAQAMVLLGIVLGLLYLVRPQQITVVLPLLVSLRPMLRQPARRWGIGLGAAAGIVVAMVAVQAGLRTLASGRLAMGAYEVGGIAFDWLHPDLWTVLLSPARGLLWMSPIVLLAALGYIVTGVRALPASFAVFAAQGLIQTFVIASWMEPAQGDAFGARMWTDCAAAVACGIALLYQRAARPARLLLTIAIAVCVAWTIRLLWLYVEGRLSLGMPYGEVLRQAIFL